MLLIAIPALNEAGSIAKVIDDVKVHLPEANILVIDDGSIDNTASIAISKGVDVLSIPFNIGVGGAIRLAFRYAHLNGYDSVLQIDADGQHMPSEAQALLANAPINSVTVGSRFALGFEKYKVSSSRKLVMKFLAKILSYLCGTRLTDVTSGFRLTKGREIIEVFSKIYPRDYLGDTVESLILAKRHKFKILELPVQMLERQSGHPSQNFLKSVWYLLRVLLVILLSLMRRNAKV